MPRPWGLLGVGEAARLGVALPRRGLLRPHRLLQRTPQWATRQSGPLSSTPPSPLRDSPVGFVDTSSAPREAQAPGRSWHRGGGNITHLGGESQTLEAKLWFLLQGAGGGGRGGGGGSGYLGRGLLMLEVDRHGRVG